MKKLLTLTAAAAAAAFAMTSAAGAATFVFKGDGLNATPLGVPGVDFEAGCASAQDFCSIDHSAGLNYSVGGLGVNVTALADNQATRLIQDVFPSDSGLGAWSEDDGDDDQTQFNSGESVKFTFDTAVFLSNIEFNAGNDTNCSTFGSEGPCGFFDLIIDGVFFANIEAVDLLATTFEGTIFEFVATTADAGFAIAKFDVREVPVPGALPLLLSGIAGLGFASRRRKKA